MVPCLRALNYGRQGKLQLSVNEDKKKKNMIMLYMCAAEKKRMISLKLRYQESCPHEVTTNSKRKIIKV